MDLLPYVIAFNYAITDLPKEIGSGFTLRGVIESLSPRLDLVLNPLQFTGTLVA